MDEAQHGSILGKGRTFTRKIAFYMDKLSLLLRSRTAWTIVVMFLVGGVQAVDAFIPVGAKPLVEGALAFTALYFRANPKA